MCCDSEERLGYFGIVPEFRPLPAKLHKDVFMPVYHRVIVIYVFLGLRKILREISEKF